MQVLSSLSGLPFSAVSAGFAPTNSADVSAIASGYQVVSSTATQLHAGTAYLTSVNEAPISASRAGQAANASLATSAYYDGTGRLISALPDSAAVSAIASSYAESAASGKQDELTFGYDANNLISSIDGSALAGQGGGGGGAGVVTSVSSYSGYATAINESSIMTVPSAHAYYTSSALNVKDTAQFNNRYVSPYVDSSTLYMPPGGCNSVLISGIGNGNIYYSASATLVDGTTASASYGLSENSGIFKASANISAMRLLTRSISNYYYRTAYLSAGAYRPSGDAIIPLLSPADLDAAVLKADSQIAVGGSYANTYSLAIGTGAKAYGASVAIGEAYITASAQSIAIGYANSATIYGFAGGASNTATGSAMAHGYGNNASGQSLSVGAHNSSQSASVALGTFNTAGTTSVAMGSANTASQASLVQGIQNSGYWNSLAVGSSNKAGSRSLAVGVSSTADKTAIAQGRGCYASGNSFAQGSFNSATDYSFAQGYGLSAANTLAAFGTYNKSSNGADATGAAFVLGDGTAEDALHDLMVVTKDGEITMFSGTADTVGTGIMSSIRAISAAATGGGGGVDSATVSAIASAYVESGVSSKLDSSASSDFYSTGNPSGFVGSSYVESSVSGKQDASAMSSYALSSDVSGTVDLVSSQSANWGGSALQLSAGDGISLTMSGNILIIATASA